MKSQISHLGKFPVVVLPLDEYEKMKEDLEMLRSKRLEGSIKKARKEIAKGKVYTVEEVKKALKLN